LIQLCHENIFVLLPCGAINHVLTRLCWCSCVVQDDDGEERGRKRRRRRKEEMKREGMG
jgi:hypothetical protein